MNNCILIISHSNYRIKSGGVEKFLRDYCKILELNDVHYIHVFPVIEVNKKLRRFKSEYIALSFDGIFEGIWNKNNFVEAVYGLAARKFCRINNIQIHHLYGWNIHYLTQSLKKLQLPIYIFIHDLETLCPSMFCVGANSQCMQLVPVVGEEPCNYCCYRDYDFVRVSEIKYFWDQIYSQIEFVYTPSDNTKKHFLRAFPQFEKITKVREHLIYDLKHTTRKINKKIRIAYIGSIGKHKGYNEWRELLEAECDKNYQFYYFGIEDIEDSRVRCVKVDDRDPILENMETQLIAYNIDIVFLWSKCQETFCYTYYESTAAGTFILTNKKSGNICDQVEKWKNGKIFEDISQCIRFLDNVNSVAESLKIFSDSNIIPINIRTNDSIIGELCGDSNSISIENVNIELDRKKESKAHKKVFLSLLYKKMRT